ncbi:hypothetical protein [Candidatus Trichorickettsia mobilis]|uniref:hypothetical protein n=1 Tax=Candidatus Trichorickettsia mobilis TaxID=1346319 RepID=UPI00292EBDD1|nr:hypothetical protein [Candidatus Trichorickettsia mobilis]
MYSDNSGCEGDILREFVTKPFCWLLHIKFLLVIILLMLSCEVFANFGDSCTTIPASNLDNDLRANTAYGHLIGNIDMTAYVEDACDVNNSDFTFCLKNATGATPICNPITMKVGDSRTLGSMNTNSELGGSPVLKDMVLTVRQLETIICLTMPTSRGSLPIACKQTKLPPPPPAPEDNTCKTIGQSCYGASKSQSLDLFRNSFTKLPII